MWLRQRGKRFLYGFAASTALGAMGLTLYGMVRLGTYLYNTSYGIYIVVGLVGLTLVYCIGALIAHWEEC